jgi:hypothetical protein
MIRAGVSSAFARLLLTTLCHFKSPYTVEWAASTLDHLDDGHRHDDGYAFSGALPLIHLSAPT